MIVLAPKGPLYDDDEFAVSAQREGFHFEVIKAGHFRALKLGEISVLITNQNKQPVPGVLLSVISGDANKFRATNTTNAQGKFVFSGLFSGQYFLRPLLKEYEFTPKSKPIQYVLSASLLLRVQMVNLYFPFQGC